MNMLKISTSEDNLASLFRLLSQPLRLQILLVIGEREACVCHLEAVLGFRQATISQQLMVLRDSLLVTANRDGKNIYYRLANPKILSLIRQAAEMMQYQDLVETLTRPGPVDGCPCPHCAEDAGLQPGSYPETCS